MITTTNNILYCNSLTEYSRLKTRVVKIGNLELGGDNPIRIQSMTTTDTMNTIATVEQSIRMIEAGCELVRITAPSIHEAENLRNIKAELNKRGYYTPLVADIHFTPNAAELAARIVEKVRVNPGNYADKKKFENIEYTDAAYDAELERIRNRFIPLIKVCKEYGTAMRIGTNHGSLSDRIMSRYGDTPLGMVESALEFVRICRELSFNEIVLSMKSSNPLVMVQAYRLLIVKMKEEDMDYPLHLGVTEAGEGEDGRIKSAVGIGTLLEDGIGDTIRVSLTEDPEFEIPVAKALVNRFINHKRLPEPLKPITHYPINPFEHKRRDTNSVVNIGGKHVPVVIVDYREREGDITPEILKEVGYNYNILTDKWNISDMACDYICIGNKEIDFEIPGTLGIIQYYDTWKNNKHRDRYYPLFNIENFFEINDQSPILNFLGLKTSYLTTEFINKIKDNKTLVLNLYSSDREEMIQLRRAFVDLINEGCKTPAILSFHFPFDNENEFQLYFSTNAGALLVDGLGDGLWDDCVNEISDKSSKLFNQTAFGILQATRTRISKTEYISCPSCGRTLFDLQETTAKIRSRTNHLKGLKIGIMGCIVNGPGEMADADYGYVGTGPGKITLYKGKEVVRRNVPSEQAVDALIDLIKEGGDWVEQ